MGRLMDLTMEVDAPREEVFDLMADVENETAWNPDLIEVHSLTPDKPLGAGSEWEGRYKGMGTMRIRLVECERPERLEFTTTGDRMDMRFRFDYSEDGPERTRVAVDADMTPRGPMRLLGPVLGPMMRRTMAKRPAQIAEGLRKTHSR